MEGPLRGCKDLRETHKLLIYKRCPARAAGSLDGGIQIELGRRGSCIIAPLLEPARRR